ncbi:aminotransferase class III-fold pyridoxal phosphate-dependent enzyme [Aliiglaciecola sp. CAU 1673]|uniref:aminotransferase class III-fold pyridoxal phosphate-dependent enzyme n=1 Tax=Aliiglaciecola sp. CAU 1673 TaxID=3032595 RepID=UPI0023D98D2F|nr:aminotransferase class III-fold pyridoxal phosphate-dependent enzyme [Aliiglaciecola sp. CAU 1673]MDF2177042.1 aminotransferase class III-fold pyridoxal phosphate-dependent enzyme [Aliiglaciecola sp. CAU 1673]
MSTTHPSIESMRHHWLAFTSNRRFHQSPKLVSRAEGIFFETPDGHKLYDSLSSLWCSPLGHANPGIAKAISEQVNTLDYAPAFNVSHPLAFEVAQKLASMMPGDLDHILFCNSGSEAADTALKLARAYWRAKGRPEKTKFVGRSKGYHGVNFGGIAVGGIGPNRKIYGQTLDAYHLPHTLLAENRFSKGVPEHGDHLADALEQIIEVQDASNIAAVIVEPMAGSGGVIIPSQGYLKRLRALCDKHDILLIFDEVITGFGRLGTMFGAQFFDVQPDMLTCAKALTNGIVPMGAVAASTEIYQTLMQQPGDDFMIEFPHGYTYSAHPLACAAALSSLEQLSNPATLAKVQSLVPVFEEAIHGLKDLPLVEDIRNIGLAGAIQVKANPGHPLQTASEISALCWQKGVYVRFGGNNLSFAPPFICEPEDIKNIFSIVAQAIGDYALGIQKHQ